jgi:hypothetical protein
LRLGSSTSWRKISPSALSTPHVAIGDEQDHAAALVGPPHGDVAQAAAIAQRDDEGERVAPLGDVGDARVAQRPAGAHPRPDRSRFPGEESCITLVWAVLDLLITHQTNGVHSYQLDRHRLKRMRYEGTDQLVPNEVTAA